MIQAKAGPCFTARPFFWPPFYDFLVMKNSLAALHQHLGSDAEVFRIMRLFYRRMEKDAMLGFFFSGRDVDQVADRQSEFLLRAMGARSSYSGKPPSDAHQKLQPILPGHFDRRAVILKQTLEAEHLPPQHIHAWLEFEAAFRDALVKTQP